MDNIPCPECGTIMYLVNQYKEQFFKCPKCMAEVSTEFLQEEESERDDDTR